ncbi:MAG TPA: hypothetical protein VHO07_23185 [Streptosporangiaceae bacterium]|nr:hypothetical protein [Streptosporangiaceae bacterium]
MYQPYPGSTDIPETQRPPAPPSVLNAVKVMYVGAATSIIGIALATVDTLGGLSAPIAGLVKIWAILVWLVGLAAVVFLWRRSSTAFFKSTPA